MFWDTATIFSQILPTNLFENCIIPEKRAQYSALRNTYDKIAVGGLGPSQLTLSRHTQQTLGARISSCYYLLYMCYVWAFIGRAADIKQQNTEIKKGTQSNPLISFGLWAMMTKDMQAIQFITSLWKAVKINNRCLTYYLYTYRLHTDRIFCLFHQIECSDFLLSYAKKVD